MELISSRSNPKIKQLRSLKSHKGRLESGSFLVEGIVHVGEAAEAAQAGKLELQALYYAPDLLKSEFARALIREQSAGGIPCHPVTVEVFESLAGKVNPQGILAVAEARAYKLEALDPANLPWGVALVAPQDPGNLGAILRSIDAVGASGLILLDGGADPYHPTCVRASMGALFWQPVARASFGEFASWAQGHGYTVYGTSAHAQMDAMQIEYFSRPLILLLGSEREGLTPEQASICDHLLRLPMRGRVSSLNLAVAAGVMLYSILEKME
jgi:TrmH family RNA methyltransferase